MRGQRPSHQLASASEQREFRYAYGSNRPTQSIRQLNLPWLIGTLVVLSIATPSIYFWHQYQLQRVATAMLERADTLEAEGEFRKASDYLFRCLQLSPQDSRRHRELTIRIAESYDRSLSADTQSVIAWYQRAVAAENDPRNNDALRTRLAELYLSVGEYQLSKAQIEQVQQPTARSLRVTPLCRFYEFQKGGLQVRPQELLNELQQLRQPGSIEVATAVAQLQREFLPANDGIDRDAEADRTMDELVRNAATHAAANDEHVVMLQDEDRDATYQALAHLARFEYELLYDKQPNGHDVSRALELAPRRADVLLAAARQAREQKAWATAIQRYQVLLDDETLVDSQRSRGYLGLGEAYQRSGDIDAAIETWTAGVESVRQGRLPILVRLVETLTHGQRLPEAARRLKQLDTAVSRLEMYGRRSNRDWAIASRDLCRARLLMAHREFAQAAPILNRITLTAQSRNGRRAEESIPYVAAILLGQCQLELQRWPDAANSFEQALEFAPQSSTARIWAAKAWSAAGRDRAAIDLCEQVAAREDAPENVWLMLAQLYLRDQLRLPPGSRDWRRLEEVLAKAATVLPDSWEIPLVRSNLLLVRDGADAMGQVLQILTATETAHPNALPLWSNLVFMYDRLQLPEQADRALTHLEQLQPNSVKSQAWRIALLANRGELDAAEQHLQLITRRQEASPGAVNEPTQEEQGQVWIDRSRLFLAYQQGATETVAQVLHEMHQRYPQNVEIMVQLADLAHADQNWSQVDRWRDAVHQAEGDEGIWWRWLDVRRLLANPSTLTPETWQRIDRRYNELRKVQPWWGGTAMVRGLIADAQGRQRDASLAFAEAIQGGFNQPAIYEKLARSLYSEGRFDEAGQWLLQLQQQQPLDVRLLDLAWSSARQQNQTQWAMRLARENLERHASDPLAYVWMAQILIMNGVADEADQLIAKARALEPTDVASWAAMLSYHLQTGQLEPAADCLAVLEQHEDLPIGQKALLAAQAYAQLGKPSLARQKFQQAVDTLPDDIEARVLYAEFERAYDPDRALELIREANHRAPENDQARRLLAAWLFTETDTEAQRQANRLLRQRDQNGRTADSDKRLEASLLIRRGRPEDLIQAQELLESLVAQDNVSDEDRLALAYLYERTQNVSAAMLQFETLVRPSQPAARSLAAYVDFLLRRGELERAQRELARLERQAPMSLSAVSLRSRLFLAEGQDDLIDAHLETFARRRLDALDDVTERRQVMRQVARLFAAVKRDEGAERWFRRLASEYPQHNDDLATYLLLKNKTDQAIQFATQQVNETLTADTAALYAQVLVHADQGETDWSRADELLTEAYQQHKSNAKLLFSLASLRLKQGNTDEAIRLLKELTTQHPQHVTGWNNLAAILADDPQRLDEALVCVNRAIDSAGRPIANLLDTKAVILLLRNENEAAAQLLQRVLALPQAGDPRFHFHLAVARQRLGRDDEAKQAWLRSLELGLFKTYLTAYERQLATRLAEAFGAQPASTTDAATSAIRPQDAKRNRVDGRTL